MLADKIYTALRRAYKEAGTQEELQRKTGVDHSLMSKLLGGRRSCGGLRVDTLEKLFPDMEVAFFKNEREGLVADPDVFVRRVAQLMSKLNEDEKAECLESVASIAAIHKGKKEKVADDEQELSAGA